MADGAAELLVSDEVKESEGEKVEIGGGKIKSGEVGEGQLLRGEWAANSGWLKSDRYQPAYTSSLGESFTIKQWGFQRFDMLFFWRYVYLNTGSNVLEKYCVSIRNPDLTSKSYKDDTL